MARRESNDWVSDELLPRIKSKAGFGATVFWLAIWWGLGFHPWIGLGLFFAWGGSVGLFGGKPDKFYEFNDKDEDDRGYRRALGSETHEAASARLSGEPVAEQSPPPPLPMLHRQVIADAAFSRARLEAAASVGESDLGVRLRNMLARVKEVEAGLESEPGRLSDVQRLFTYYLPATADLLAARGAIMGNSDTKRLAEIDAMIGKLDLAFTDFANRLKGHDVRSLEIDLRLLESSLNEELFSKTKT